MRTFIICCVCLAATCYSEDSSIWRQEIEQIDIQIKELKEKQMLYNSQKLQAEDRADRFDDQGRMLDARRAWRQADEADRRMAENQVMIDDLEKRKASILTEHPEAGNP